MRAADSGLTARISSSRTRCTAASAGNHGKEPARQTMSTSNNPPARPTPGPKLPPYGPSITIAQAKIVADAALEPARENSWTVVVAIVDPGGYLVYLERLDQTQVGSVAIAESKAR